MAEREAALATNSPAASADGGAKSGGRGGRKKYASYPTLFSFQSHARFYYFQKFMQWSGRLLYLIQWPRSLLNTFLFSFLMKLKL